MTVPLETYNTLLTALYHGGREEPHWQKFLTQLCAISGSRLAMLNLAHPRPGDPGVLFFGGEHFDEEQQLRYANDFSNLDPFVNLPDGKALTLTEVVPRSQLEDTVYYREFMLPTDLVQILGIDIRHEGSTLYLRAIRGQQAPAFGDAERKLFSLLEPHLRQLLEWLQQTRRIGLELGIYEGIASHLHMATVQVDRDGNIIECNPIARALLNDNALLGERQGRLVARRPSDHTRLQHLLKEGACRTEASPAIAPALRIEGMEPGGGLYLLVKPLRPGSGIREVLPSDDDNAVPRFAVYICAARNLSPAQREILQQLFGLTPSEAQLAIALANGESLEQIAEQRCVSRNTLRTHLRGAFQKTGVKQQSALVSLVLRSIAGMG